VDRLFLDANVLFSAAYRPDAGVARLWVVSDAVLLTSSYVVEETRRNLTTANQETRLEELLEKMEVGEAMMLPPELRGKIDLPEKDWPGLGGAAAAGATHLITGDLRHFGAFFGEKALGVLVLKPADYLRGLK
jgi:predicted nucleic acid-binding protein